MRTLDAASNRWILATLSSVLSLCLGAVYAWSYFQPLLVEEYRWSNTEASWAFSVNIFFLGLSAALGGINLPKFGPKKLAVAGALLFTGGYAVAAAALALKSLLLFYLGYGVLTGTGTGLAYVTPMSTVTRWFPDRKGLVTGMVSMGFGLGAFVVTVILAPFLMRILRGNLPWVFAALGGSLGAVTIASAVMVKNPPAGFSPRGYTPPAARPDRLDDPYAKALDATDLPLADYVLTGEFGFMWLMFFLNIAAGISIISLQSPLYQDIWRFEHPALERSALTAYGAALIAASSLCNGLGRIFWGAVSERLGRVNTFRVLLASQMVVFGILMTEHDPWVFAILICYVLGCFGGGFAVMPSLMIDVYGQKRMSRVFGVILTAWAAAGILGPLMVASLKDNYPDRAIAYIFLLGIHVLGAGFIFSFLVNDEPFIPRGILLNVLDVAAPRTRSTLDRSSS
jgi:OFA family oxalate/formate antiporter-like MFS transporter